MRILKRILIIFITVAVASGCFACKDNSGVPEQSRYTVHFEVCAPEGIQTNIPGDRSIVRGETVDKPVVSQRGNSSYYIEGWYEESAYVTEWDFNIDVVEKDMTLYAKWGQEFTVNYYSNQSGTTAVYSETIKKGKKTVPSDDIFTGYKVNGYYYDAEHTREFDFDQPITADTDVYADTSASMYMDAYSIKKSFQNRAAPSGGNEAVAGDMYVRSDDGEEYVEINFGYCETASDPCIIMSGVEIDIRRTQKLKITYKNLGQAGNIRIFFAVKDGSGNYLGGDGDDPSRMVRYDYKSNEKGMSKDDDWAVMEFDLSAVSEEWRNAYTLCRLRIDNQYKSKNPDDYSNIMYIKSIEGETDERYFPDVNRYTVTYHVGENTVLREDLPEGEIILADERLLAGYAGKKYYTSADYTSEYSFGKPIDGNVDIYVRTEEGFYYSAKEIYDYFKVYAASVSGSVAGGMSYDANEDYVRIDFGASKSSDPYFGVNADCAYKMQQDLTEIDTIEIRLKNIGAANGVRLYVSCTGQDGTFVTGSVTGFAENGNVGTYVFTDSEKNMTGESEWLTVTFDLTELKEKGADRLNYIRIQSVLTADSGNVWHVQSVRGYKK